jgi:hypothetical protein
MTVRLRAGLLEESMRASLVRRENIVEFERPTRPSLLAALAGTLVALLLCVALANAADADDDDDGGEYVPRQVVVKIKPGDSIRAIERTFRVERIERLPGTGEIYLVKTRRGVNPANLARRMELDGRVLYAEPNFRAGLPEASKFHRARPGGVPTPGSEPAQYRSQYAVDNLNLTEAHAVNRGAGSVVAVVDTGVQANHPELSGKLTEARYDFVDRDGIPADRGNGSDDDRDGEVDETVGHGTHVAGIVALAAPEARIMPLRALDSEGRGTTFGVAKAIRYAIRNDADVVNLSLGSSRETELLEDLIGDDDDDEAGRTVFVAAAGNDNDTRRQFPAAEEGAISVTSAGEDGTRSGFANYGAWISIAAPGDDIHSPFPVSGYAAWSGTSMATPFVAAQAALIRGARPSAGGGCVAGIIQRTARPSSDTSLRAGHADVEASTKYAADPARSCSGAGDDD